MSESTDQHRAAAQGQTARCGVLTVSDTRTKETDKGGRVILDALRGAGHTVAYYEIARDDPGQIAYLVKTWIDVENLDVVITTGGTGIASRDTTIEVVERMLDKRLEGFGELFRMLSWQEIGPAAMLSRATAGLSAETLIFALPGSTNAVKLAMEKLIIPELPHLVWERRR